MSGVPRLATSTIPHQGPPQGTQPWPFPSYTSQARSNTGNTALTAFCHDAWLGVRGEGLPYPFLAVECVASGGCRAGWVRMPSPVAVAVAQCCLLCCAGCMAQNLG